MSPIHHSMRWAPTVELAEQPSTLICPPDALALPDESLQLVIIHHLLEIVPNPHRLLQESARLTSDEGCLIIFGWAPLGVAGLSRLSPGRGAGSRGVGSGEHRPSCVIGWHLWISESSG
ncbi:methyltransferase domain-containing protein [Halomonas sp. BC04]|uniref:methyltransferase domain-containing protein n=1 Tax=Halomonas sp. BC04 TaxID=1403540 RepID=UPI0003ED6BAA|nr:methyltransferase domain-containing protein [Halomonas sp. BC04]EWG99192.1 hypothetical protein Q427_26580 [Halomonas sp. BC04]